MKGVYNINWKAAPHEWKAFQRWHGLACPSDPLSAEERFVKEGGKLPDKKKGKNDDDSGTSKAVK